MKALLLLTLFAGAPAYASHFSVRVVPIVSHVEKSALPPELIGTVSLYCYERVLRPIREEVTQADGTVTVVAGALILREDHSVCSQGPGPVEISFGPLYSGRPYEVVPLTLH